MLLVVFFFKNNYIFSPQPISPSELWRLIHGSYGEELGLTTDDDDYVAPPPENDNDDDYGNDVAEEEEDFAKRMMDGSKVGRQHAVLVQVQGPANFPGQNCPLPSQPISLA